MDEVVNVPSVPSEAALILPSFGSGGAERVVLNLARGLVALGCAVRMVVLDGRGPLRAGVPDGVEIVELGRPRAREAAPALVRHLRRRPPDLVIASQTHLNVLLGAIRPLLSRTCRLVLREPNLRPESRPERITDRAIGRMLGRADLVIASSPAMSAHLAATVRGRGHVIELANPVDLAALRTAAARGTGRLPDAPTGTVRLAIVGRLNAQKAHDDLLRALARTPEGSTLTIVGDGPLRPSLERLRDDLGLHERVRFLGQLDDHERLAATVATSDLIVHPAHFDGMPNAVLESLALGTPVLATTDLRVLGAIAELVGPQALRLVPREDLADALRSATPAPGPFPRPSLLPPGFRLETVVRDLLTALEDRTGPFGP